MKRSMSAPQLVIAAFAIIAAPLGASAQTTPPSSAISALVVKPHTGAEAIDVDGSAAANSVLTITLVSTFSLDLPDVVLSRTNVDTDARGAFSTVISLAPGYTRGSIVTVYATSTDGG